MIYCDFDILIYLITKKNCAKDEVFNGLKNLVNAGVDSVRFSFPQLPRGKDNHKDTIIPNRNEVVKFTVDHQTAKYHW